MSDNPNSNPLVSQTSQFRPTATVVGNRETRPNLSQWINLFSVPTNPIDAIVVSLQWLFMAKASAEIALITPVAIQVAFGAFWLLMAVFMVIAANKDTAMVRDCLFTTTSALLGFILAIL